MGNEGIKVDVTFQFQEFITSYLCLEKKKHK